MAKYSDFSEVRDKIVTWATREWLGATAAMAVRVLVAKAVSRENLATMSSVLLAFLSSHRTYAFRFFQLRASRMRSRFLIIFP